MFEGQDRTVLLVEDEAIIALTEKRTLEKNGLNVHVAHNGEKAIQTALELFDAHTRLEKSERRYRTMVDTAPMPFQSLDDEGRIIDVNRAWLEALGYERKEILGTWFGDLLPVDQVELFRERFPIFKARGRIEKVDFRLRCADGTFLHTLFNGCISYQEDGSFSHTVCIFQVLTPAGEV